MKTMMSIKIDKELKEQAQAISKELGLSMSSVISNYLKKLVQEREVVFSQRLEPNDETKKVLKEIAQKGYEKDSVGFDSSQEADEYLMSL